MFGGHEALLNCVVELLKQRVVIAVYVEDSTWFFVYAQLRPRDDLTDFFERSVASRQSNEGIGKICHQGFSSRAWNQQRAAR